MSQSSVSIGEQIVAAQTAGDHLKVYDLAEAALKLHPDNEFYQYSLVLSLAKCDAAQRALDSFYHYKLYLSQSADVLALEARILKDLAFARPDEASLHKAADSYHKIFTQTGDYYRAINAATLYLLSGNRQQAVALAEQARALAQQDGQYKFYNLATQAAALLVLGRPAEAQAVIVAVAQLEAKDLVRRARTRQRLKLICDYQLIDDVILDCLLPETVIYYCGHVFDPHRPVSESQEVALLHHIETTIASHHAAVAYGSLAAGADILFAETVLKNGGELNIWLPFGKADFCARAVSPAGEAWVARFEACLLRAHTVSYATESNFMGDDAIFEYCADIGMGMAIMRANSLEAAVLQLAVRDEVAQDPASGVCRNIAKWRSLNKPVEVIPCPLAKFPRELRTIPQEETQVQRELHAILFSDVRGYSKLSDRDVLWYFNVLNPHLATAIEKFRPDIQLIDTWGDGIYMITKRASVAAQIAFELNEALAQLDQSMLELDEPLLMRIGLHYGPVFSLYDHFEQKQTYSSNEVSKTARIEPVTPAGEIFGTEAFVAILELEGDECATFEYAGTLPSAKNYGSFRMFHIRPELQAGPILKISGSA